MSHVFQEILHFFGTRVLYGKTCQKKFLSFQYAVRAAATHWCRFPLKASELLTFLSATAGKKKRKKVEIFVPKLDERLGRNKVILQE